MGIASIIMLTLRLCGPPLHDESTNDAAASLTKSLDNDFSALLELAWISQTQICRLADITPRISSKYLLFYW